MRLLSLKPTRMKKDKCEKDKFQMRVFFWCCFTYYVFGFGEASLSYRTHPQTIGRHSTCCPAQLFVSVQCTTLLVFGALRFSHLQVHFRLSQIHLQLLLLFLQALQFGAEFCAPVRGTKVKIKLVKILMKIACKYRNT